MTMNIEDFAVHIAEQGNFQGYQLSCQPIPGEVDVLEISVEGFEELPVYISTTDTQILCITYLWTEDEVKTESRAEMMESLLEMNIPMPLSSFAKIGDRYVIFGALAVSSEKDEVLYEVTTLVENGVEAIAAMEEYLK